MSRIKGSYTATLTIKYDFEHRPDEMLPVDEIKKRFTDGTLTDMIKEMLNEGDLEEFHTSLEVIQQFAECTEVVE